MLLSERVCQHRKLKTDKAQEIKKLNQQIQMVQSDMSKHREALEDCLRLDVLTGSLAYARRGPKNASVGVAAGSSCCCC